VRSTEKDGHASWAGAYIGIPFADRGRDRHGVDCWGLVRLVLAEQFGVGIPSYDEVYFHTRDFAAQKQIYDAQEAADCWLKVMDGYGAPGAERPGDVVHMRIDVSGMHVGIVIAPGRMLHARDNSGHSVIERIGGTAWKNRVRAIYRHRELAGRD